MKLVCIFISFVMVNGCADDQEITNYIKEVFITNNHIQKASSYNHMSVGGNGLEYVIKSIVYGDQYWIDQLNYMIAVPDKTNLTNMQEPISEYINQQRAMQEEIKVKLSIPVPQVQDQNFGHLDLTKLGEYRRLLTGKALKNIIMRVLRLRDPNTTLSQFCRLMGLITSTKIAKIFSTTHKTDPYLCVLWDGADHYIKYRTFEGVFYQVAVNDIDTKIELLWAQLV